MMKKIFFALFAVLPFSLSAQAPQKGPLDGKTYITEILEDGKKKPLDPDDLKFNAGKFKSALFADWGFTKAAKYEITTIDSTTTPNTKTYSWIVDLVNEENEKLSWSGTITGDEIEGNIELINKKGAVKKSYSFTGKQKKKAGQK